MPDSANPSGHNLILNGAGIRKATVLNLHVYVAGLYLPEKETDGDEIVESNIPWLLKLVFVRDVDAASIKEAFDKRLSEGGGAKLLAVAPDIGRLEAALKDAEKGNYLSFFSDAMTGVKVDLNGERQITLDEDIAGYLLDLWVGKDPPDKELKSGLLGGVCQ
jgi:hypothetical protein